MASKTTPAIFVTLHSSPAHRNLAENVCAARTAEFMVKYIVFESEPRTVNERAGDMA
jgi:hypothetical protein